MSVSVSVNALQLIELVRSNDVLYNIRHPAFHDYQHKEAIWAGIEAQLNCPEGEGKRKWTMLRDAYRRNLKILRSNPNRKAFKFSRQMSFLKPHFQKLKVNEDTGRGRERGGGEEHSRRQFDNNRDGPEEVELDEQMDAEAFAECLLGSELDEEEESRLIVDDVRSLEIGYKQPEIVLPNLHYSNRVYPVANKKSDVIDAFLLGIGATLKTFSPYYMNIAKQRIFSAVSELEMEQIMTAGPSSSSSSSATMTRVSSSVGATRSSASSALAGKSTSTAAAAGCSPSTNKDYTGESASAIKEEPAE